MFLDYSTPQLNALFWFFVVAAFVGVTVLIIICIAILHALLNRGE